jgi:pyridoxamine 5'-phosphate oxidase
VPDQIHGEALPPGESFGADPIVQLVADRERARVAGDPLADVCILATTDVRDRTGAPAVRPLVLRDVGPAGLGLLVSASSPKWTPLAEGRYECLLLWLAIRRQYRIRGGLSPMPESRVANYWANKVHASRLLDRYYVEVQPQSSEVVSRARFLDGVAGLDARYPTADSVPRPDLLRGVDLVPERVEVWRGSPDRLHDRHVYTRRGAGWSEAVLVP